MYVYIYIYMYLFVCVYIHIREYVLCYDVILGVDDSCKQSARFPDRIEKTSDGFAFGLVFPSRTR